MQHLRNESVCEIKVFFFKKMPETKIFRVARMGHHTKPVSHKSSLNCCLQLLALPLRNVSILIADQGTHPGHKKKPEIAQTQSWRYKTIVVIKCQQQTTISKKCIALFWCGSGEVLHFYFLA